MSQKNIALKSKCKNTLQVAVTHKSVSDACVVIHAYTDLLSQYT